jgi:hypothetical protein
MGPEKYVNARSLFLGGALLLLFATGAHAGGKYQRTKDGRTRVWNNYPQAGDMATWSGNRDAYGYATGYGTLVWYTTDRKTLTGSNLATAQYKEGSSYSGTMVHGKLDGMVVNVDANGETFHGIFIDGRKTSDWAAGPAPSPSSPIALPEESTLPRPEPSVVGLEQLRKEIARQASAPKAPAQEPSPAPPAEGPASIPVRLSSQSLGAASPIPQSTAVTSPSPVAAVTDSAPTSPPQRDALHAALTKRPSPAAEKSLRSLTGPPSSLTNNSVGEDSPLPGVTSTSSSPPPAGSRLTSAEVMALADTEVRSHGFDLHSYQRLQPEYKEADEVWSVSYDQMSANGMSGRHFSVSVEDKTKKTSIDAER